MSLDATAMLDALVVVLPGLVWTVAIAALALACSLIVGITLSFVRISIGSLAGRIVAVLTGALRSVPELPMIFAIYFGLPEIGLQLGAATCGVIALSTIGAAHVAEILRSGYLAVPAGQSEVARALGLSIPRAWRRVLFPQIRRHVMPPIVNLATELIKSTTLLAAIGLPEIANRANTYAGSSFRYFEAFTIIALVFIALITPLSLWARKLEPTPP
jgi:L-cystine transport system permease protein